MKNILLLFVLVSLSHLAFAQYSPSNDPNWILQTSLSDEFNAAAIDETKWDILTCSPFNCCNWGGGSGWTYSNAFLENGNLMLKAENVGTCNGTNTTEAFFRYKTAGIVSLGEVYDYGYLEIYAQFPGFVDADGVGHAKKFWPAFWTFSGDGMNYPSCPNNIHHDEIDIVDQCCSIYDGCKITGAGAWDDSEPDPAACNGTSIPWMQHASSSFLCNSYHKFAVEWNSDRIIFYFDDIPWYINFTPVNMDLMHAVIDLQISNHYINGVLDQFDSNMPWPQFMKVDYFRYYTLNLDCLNEVVILNTTELNAFQYSIKKKITIGNNSTIINQPSNTSKIMRFTDDMTINGEFNVPLGSELAIIPTPCN